MKTQCYRIHDNRKMERLAPQDGVSLHLSKNVPIWIDVQSSDHASIEEWLDQIKVTGLSKKLCLQSRDRPGFYPFKDEFFMVIPMLAKTEESQEVDYLAVFCRSNLMLTLHTKSFMDRENTESLSESDSWLPGPTIGGLLSALMITLSLRLLQWTIDLRGNILELEDKMDRDPEDVEADDIFDLRQKLLTLGSAASDNLPVLEALHNMERDFLDSNESRDYLNCAVTNVKAADASLGWLDQRIGALRAGFDMFAQDKTNRRLNMLTVLSAIFMPITLMAGIWGMNFEHMPELKYAFAYPLALGSMLSIGIICLVFFKKFGWFD